MHNLLSNIAARPEVGPLLVLQAATPWETSFESCCGLGVTETVDGTKTIYAYEASDPSAEPPQDRAHRPQLTVSAPSGGKLSINIPDLQGADPELLEWARAICGMATVHADGSLTATIDEDTWIRRIDSVDHAWIVLRALRLAGATSDEASAMADELFSLATAWDKLRMLDFEPQAPGRPAATAHSLDQVEPAAQALALRAEVLTNRFPILREVVFYGDPRGAALKVKLPRHDEEQRPVDIMALQLNWPLCKFTTAVKPTPHGQGKLAVQPSKVPVDVLEQMQTGIRGPGTLRLPFQLEPSLFSRVKAFLESLGGCWCTSSQAFVFDTFGEDSLHQALSTGFVFTDKDFEFFPTPGGLAQRMLAKAGLKPGMKVLEPEAGQGDIAMAAAQVVGMREVTVFELMPRNVARLQERGFAISAPTDFLTVEPGTLVDAVLLNPPFSGGRDVTHIRHAWRFVAPGGTLVAISSPTWCTGKSKAAREFSEFLAELGAEVEDVPAGTFKASGTNVATKLITIRKPVLVDRAPAPSPPPAAAKPALKQSVEQQQLALIF